jgi:hypothetical protein
MKRKTPELFVNYPTYSSGEGFQVKNVTAVCIIMTETKRFNMYKAEVR